MRDPETIAVIAGIGEVVDRSRDPAATPEPLELMVQAARVADGDAGGLLADTGRTTVVHQQSWRYADTARQFCERCSIPGSVAHYGPYGGESPVRFLHQAASRIAAGTSRTELIVSGEAQYARAAAKRQNVALPWTPIADKEENAFDPAGVIDPLMAAQGVLAPAQVYPLFETAYQAHRGQTPAAGLQASAKLWARYAEVAAQRPAAWRQDAPYAAAIADPADGNRWIAWPYTKAMVANPQVNQAAAILVTSLAEAWRHGLKQEQLVFIGAGAWANEPANWLGRETYHHSPAQAAVLGALAPAQPDLFELYSCFPVVPKMAADVLGDKAAQHPTVTGGLSFFGGPLNSYMLHAAVAMTEAIRAGHGSCGLLYGQGEYVTKHHALLLTREAGQADSYDVQSQADAARGAVPPILREPKGRFTAEATTVIFDRSGTPEFGVVVARNGQGRTLARVEDEEGITRLLSLAETPVGTAGDVRLDERRRPVWRLA